ncbi:MAG: hypothetical protein WD022_05890 [Balneolaceae bacterium]
MTYENVNKTHSGTQSQTGRKLIWFGVLLFLLGLLTTLLAAIWGAGSDLMPLAADGYIGTEWQEIIIQT